MRRRLLVLPILVIGLMSCESESPSQPGTLLVSIETTGNAPDQDGYLLTVDGSDSRVVDPNDTVELRTSSGRHLLRLVGVAEHCAVDRGLSREVAVEPTGTASARFDVICEATGARVTVVTAGTDLDPDGYRVVVDGVDRLAVPANATVLALLGPGTRTITLQGFADNCSTDGAASRTVTVGKAEVVPVTFTAVCRARTGVISISFADGDAVEGVHEVRVDGGVPQFLNPGTPVYVARVTPGDHVVSLTSPLHCHVEDAELTVNVTAGAVVRDTASAVFRVTCEPTRIRITAPTTGPLPAVEYEAWACDFTNYYCYYYGPSLLGTVPPNGALVARIEPGASYSIELRDLPAACEVTSSSPVQPPVAEPGDTLSVEFQVECSP